MSIVRESYLVSSFGSLNKNSYSMPCTAEAGNRIIVSITWKESSNFTYTVPTWNGQTFTAFTTKIRQGNQYFQSYYLDVVTGGTSNITASADGYSYINAMFAVYSGVWAGAPEYLSNFDNITTSFSLPSLSTDLNENKLAIAVFNSLGWNKDYGDVTGVWTPVAPLVSVGSVSNTSNRSVWNMYFGELVGSGPTTASYTPTGTEKPLWSQNLIVLTEASSVVTSINDGNPIEAGQATIVATHTGFTGAVTSITTNRVGVTASVISGDANSTTFSISGWLDNGEYPLLDSSVTFTFSRTGESATVTQTVSKPYGYSQVTFVSPDTTDPKKFGKMMGDSGLTVDGSTLYYKTNTIPDLVINPDSSGYPVANGGTFEAWLREVDTGLMHSWLITINEAGEVVDYDRGLTAKAITATGITARAITARHL